MKLTRKGASNKQDDSPVSSQLQESKLKKKAPQQAQQKRAIGEDDFLEKMFASSPKLAMVGLGSVVMVSSLIGLWCMGAFTSAGAALPVSPPRKTSVVQMHAKVTTTLRLRPSVAAKPTLPPHIEQETEADEQVDTDLRIGSAASKLEKQTSDNDNNKDEATDQDDLEESAEQKAKSLVPQLGASRDETSSSIGVGSAPKARSSVDSDEKEHKPEVDTTGDSDESGIATDKTDAVSQDDDLDGPKEKMEQHKTKPSASNMLGDGSDIAGDEITIPKQYPSKSSSVVQSDDSDIPDDGSITPNTAPAKSSKAAQDDDSEISADVITTPKTPSKSSKAALGDDLDTADDKSTAPKKTPSKVSKAAQSDDLDSTDDEPSIPSQAPAKSSTKIEQDDFSETDSSDVGSTAQPDKGKAVAVLQGEERTVKRPTAPKHAPKSVDLGDESTSSEDEAETVPALQDVEVKASKFLSPTRAPAKSSNVQQFEESDRAPAEQKKLKSKITPLGDSAVPQGKAQSVKAPQDIVLDEKGSPNKNKELTRSPASVKTDVATEIGSQKRSNLPAPGQLDHSVSSSGLEGRAPKLSASTELGNKFKNKSKLSYSAVPAEAPVLILGERVYERESTRSPASVKKDTLPVPNPKTAAKKSMPTDSVATERGFQKRSNSPASETSETRDHSVTSSRLEDRGLKLPVSSEHGDKFKNKSKSLYHGSLPNAKTATNKSMPSNSAATQRKSEKQSNSPATDQPVNSVASSKLEYKTPKVSVSDGKFKNKSASPYSVVKKPPPKLIASAKSENKSAISVSKYVSAAQEKAKLVSELKDGAARKETKLNTSSILTPRKSASVATESGGDYSETQSRLAKQPDEIAESSKSSGASKNVLEEQKVELASKSSSLTDEEAIKPSVTHEKASDLSAPVSLTSEKTSSSASSELDVSDVKLQQNMVVSKSIDASSDAASKMQEKAKLAPTSSSQIDEKATKLSATQEMASDSGASARLTSEQLSSSASSELDDSDVKLQKTMLVSKSSDASSDASVKMQEKAKLASMSSSQTDEKATKPSVTHEAKTDLGHSANLTSVETSSASLESNHPAVKLEQSTIVASTSPAPIEGALRTTPALSASQAAEKLELVPPEAQSSQLPSLAPSLAPLPVTTTNGVAQQVRVNAETRNVSTANTTQVVAREESSSRNATDSISESSRSLV